MTENGINKNKNSGEKGGNFKKLNNILKQISILHPEKQKDKEHIF